MHLYQATYKVKGETRRSKIWKLEFRDEAGRRRRKSLETENRKEAEGKARELLDRIAVKKEKRRAELIGERELRPPEVLLPEYRAELDEIYNHFAGSKTSALQIEGFLAFGALVHMVEEICKQIVPFLFLLMLLSTGFAAAITKKPKPFSLNITNAKSSEALLRILAAQNDWSIIIQAYTQPKPPPAHAPAALLSGSGRPPHHRGDGCDPVRRGQPGKLQGHLHDAGTPGGRRRNGDRRRRWVQRV